VAWVVCLINFNNFIFVLTVKYVSAKEIRRTPAKFNYSHTFSRFSPGGHSMVHLSSLTSDPVPFWCQWHQNLSNLQHRGKTCELD